jgi:two-component system OmpR family response regulator
MRVLLIEDDERLASLVKGALEAAAFNVDVESDGEVAHFRGDSESYEAVLLDLGLPTLDGITVMRRWRKAGKRMPILVLTARDDWEERVEVIEAGADDYLVKPFHMEELLARLRAVLRRSNGATGNRIPFGRYILDTRLLQVTRDGIPVDLTPQEYKVLSYLVQHQGEVVSQLRLAEHIYGQDGDRSVNSIEQLIGRLRRRVSDASIRTRRGFGYYIEQRR